MKWTFERLLINFAFYMGTETIQSPIFNVTELYLLGRNKDTVWKPNFNFFYLKANCHQEINFQVQICQCICRVRFTNFISVKKKIKDKSFDRKSCTVIDRFPWGNEKKSNKNLIILTFWIKSHWFNRTHSLN